jgi:hypothetical protein
MNFLAGQFFDDRRCRPLTLVDDFSVRARIHQMMACSDLEEMIMKLSRFLWVALLILVLPHIGCASSKPPPPPPISSEIQRVLSQLPKLENATPQNCRRRATIVGGQIAKGGIYIYVLVEGGVDAAIPAQKMAEWTLYHPYGPKAWISVRDNKTSTDVPLKRATIEYQDYCGGPAIPLPMERVKRVIPPACELPAVSGDARAIQVLVVATDSQLQPGVYTLSLLDFGESVEHKFCTSTIERKLSLEARKPTFVQE